MVLDWFGPVSREDVERYRWWNCWWYLRGTARSNVEKLEAQPFEFCQGRDILHGYSIGRALNDEILVTVQ